MQGRDPRGLTRCLAARHLAAVAVGVFLLGCILSGVASPGTWRSFPTQSGFPESLGGEIRGPVVLGDLDGDGHDEIVVGSTNDTLWILDGDGTVESSFYLGADAQGGAALGDVDFDGDLEIVAAAGDSVFCLDGDGLARVWSRRVEGTRTSVVLSDLSGGDATLEVVLGSYCGRPSEERVTVLESDGSDTLWERCLGTYTKSTKSTPAIADVDRDRDLDVVVGTGVLTGSPYSGYLWAFDGSTGATTWKVNIGGAAAAAPLTSPVIGDLDDDTNMDVVVGCVGAVYARDGVDGGSKWSGDAWGTVVGLALEDVDDDGKLEVLVTSYGTADSAHQGNGELRVLEHDGIKKNAVILSDEVRTSPVVADLDSDGKPEVVFATYGDSTSTLYAYTVDGNSLTLFDSASLSDVTTSTPAIGDVDPDVYAELVLGADDGKVYCLENQDTLGSARWPMENKNCRRIGRYQQVIADSLVADMSWWDSYLVDGDLAIPSAHRLIIQPGTLVEVLGDSVVKAEIKVYGDLVAKRTASQDAIRFRCRDSDMKWGGIKFKEDADGWLTRCEIRHGQYGVHDFHADTLLVRKCSIRSNWWCGVYAVQPGRLEVTGCTIDSTSADNGSDPLEGLGRGIEIRYAQAVVESNTVRRCTQWDMVIYKDTGSKVRSNTFYGDADDDQADGHTRISDGYRDTLRYEGNSHIGYGETSSLVLQRARSGADLVWIYCNNFSDEGTDTLNTRGIDVLDCMSDVLIRSNTIENKAYGYYVRCSDPYVIQYPDIGDTTVSGGQNTVESSSIYRYLGWEGDTFSSTQVKAEMNWWGGGTPGPFYGNWDADPFRDSAPPTCAVSGRGAADGAVESRALRRVALHQNHPNPFNPTTTITLTLAEAGQLRVAVFDVGGRCVVTLADEHSDAGPRSFTWDGRASNGTRAGSGVYFCRATLDGEGTANKLVLLK